MTRVTVDCHMVGQAAAGDAGNGRYAGALVAALHAGRRDHDAVSALVSTPEGRHRLDGIADDLAAVPASGVARLGRSAGRALAQMRADAGVFTYLGPAHSPCPLLLAVHDVTFMTHPHWLAWRTGRMLRALVPRAARRAGGVLVLSASAREDAAEALDVDPGRVHVVSPFPAAAFRPDPDGDATLRVRERYGLTRYCLAVGDLGPRKNLVALGEAIRHVGDGLTLALVGKPGPGGARIARDAGGRWIGHVGDEDLADLYRAAAVTAYPSLYEGFGLPVVEAMACGSPVVATNRGAVPEVAGDAAVLVEPHPRGIADGIRAALEPATADRLRAAGPARAAHYTAASMGRAAWDAVDAVTATAGADPAPARAAP